MLKNYDVTWDTVNLSIYNTISHNKPEFAELLLNYPYKRLDNVNELSAIIKERDDYANYIATDGRGLITYPPTSDEMLKVFLDYVDTNGKRIDPHTLRSKDREFWTRFIKEFYDVDIDSIDNKNTNILIYIYELIRDYNELINEYKLDKQYEDIRAKLGKLLERSILDTRKYKPIYTAFKYLITRGCPITYNNGKSLINAVELWGFNAIKLVTAERLTNYMSDKKRKNNLIEVISSKNIRERKRINDYIFAYNSNAKHK